MVLLKALTFLSAFLMFQNIPCFLLGKLETQFAWGY